MNLIKEKLRLMGKSQGWLSQRTGIGRVHLNKIVLEHVTPLLPTAMKISNALKCAVEELFKYPEK